MNSIFVIFLSMMLSSFAYSSCFQVTVQVSENKPNGDSWDANGGLPDLKACFNDDWGYRCKVKSKEKAYCKDTLRCDLGIIRFTATSTEVELIDLDFRDHDYIGTETCSAGESCKVGNATVNFKESNCE